MSTTENNKSPMFLFRTDASVNGGTGHVMRCLALAQACKAAGGRTMFLLAQSTPGLDERLREEGMPVARTNVRVGSAEDAAATLAAAKAARATWIVADGYGFDTEWQQTITAAQIPLLILDDYGHAAHYFADIVLNQNLGATESIYARREQHTQLLLGTGFVLLRDEFLRYQKPKREFSGRDRNVLVTLGGSDPDNVTSAVMTALCEASDIKITVVVGGSNPHLDELSAIAADLARPITLAVDTHDMPELMHQADVAIAAGGTTSWELMFTGLPGFVLTLADNQEAIATALDRTGLAIGLGRWSAAARTRLLAELPQLLRNFQRREQMSVRGHELVDGQGRERVLAAMKNRLSGKQ